MTPLALDNWLATLLVFGPVVASVLFEHRVFRGDLGGRTSDPTYREVQAWQIAALLAGLALAKWVTGAALPGNPWLWVLAGFFIELLGIALRLWSIRTLGKHFTRHLAVVEGHHLVSKGPYRRVRHPSYTGAILMFVGVGVGLGNALSVLAFGLLATAGFARRIPREEALLRGQLGTSYDEYARRTRRLVPGVW